MKKNRFIIVLILLMISVSINFASSQGVTDIIEVVLNKVNVEVNGVKLESDNILYEGRTYVQLKEVSELLNKEVTWNSDTFTAGIKDKSNQNASSSLSIPNDYEIIPTNNAKFVGEVDIKNGNKWYKAESKYTTVYFFNTAVSQEWVMEDIDNQFEYILNFRGLEWDGYKLPIYFYGEDVKLESDQGYYGSSYKLDQKTISISADVDYATIGFHDSKGNEIIFKEDVRHTLVHEMSHHVNIPSNLKVTDKWLDEGLAYYLAYNYDYKDVDTTKYPDYKQREFIDLIFTESEEYSVEAWLNYLKCEFKNFTEEGVSTILDFNGIARSHYGMTEYDTPDVRYIEPIVIEYLIQTYGQEKLVKLYDDMNNYNGNDFKLEEEIEKVYGKKIDKLEVEFREFTSLSEFYIK